MTPENSATGELNLNQPLLLCVGSGQRPFEKPWVNIDCQERWSPDLVCDVKTLPYEDGTVDMVCAHHVLEHLGLDDGAIALREWRRVLKPGASLLVFVPDMAAIAKRWLAGEFTDYQAMVNFYGAFMGSPADRHLWGWCYRSLREMLIDAGFSKIGLFDWRTIPGADIARDDRWILGVEASKGIQGG